MEWVLPSKDETMWLYIEGAVNAVVVVYALRCSHAKMDEIE
jgi:hypothetical protein